VARAVAAELSGGGRADIRVDAPDALVGSFDRIRIAQAIESLLSNAVKFAPGTPVEVAVAASDGKARLVVRDHGIGIPPEDQARIFERYARAVPARHYGGFGLGLWLVRRTVEAHGGSVAVASAPGEGSTFTVELPLR
jgi:signal transduction histidine kinase